MLFMYLNIQYFENVIPQTFIFFQCLSRIHDTDMFSCGAICKVVLYFKLKDPLSDKK